MVVEGRLGQRLRDVAELQAAILFGRAVGIAGAARDLVGEGAVDRHLAAADPHGPRHIAEHVLIGDGIEGIVIDQILHVAEEADDFPVQAPQAREIATQGDVGVLAGLGLEVGIAALVEGIVGEQLLGRRQAEGRPGHGLQIEPVGDVELGRDHADGGRLSDARGVVADARGQAQAVDQLGRGGDLAKHGIDALGVLFDHQHRVRAVVVLEVVTQVEIDAPHRRELAHGVDPTVHVAPGVVVVDGDQAPGGGRVVVELGEVRPPPMIVALQEELHALAGREVQLAGEDVFVAAVEGVGHGLGLGVAERTEVVLFGDGEPELVAQVDLVLPAHAEQAVFAVVLGGAGLEVLERERQESLGLVRRGVDHQPARAHRGASVAIGVIAGIGVATDGHRSVRVAGEVAGDDVHRAGDALGAVEQGLRPFDNLDALDHAGRQGVQRRGPAAVEPVVQPDPVLEEQQVLGA